MREGGPYEIAVRVLGKAVLVGGASPGEVHLVDLGDITAEGSRGDIDLVAIIQRTSRIDIKPCQDLAL